VICQAAWRRRRLARAILDRRSIRWSTSRAACVELAARKRLPG